MLFKIGVLIYGYFAGALIQAGYWMGKFNKIDIRDYGSGNAGTTNVMRTLGKKAGIATYLLDAFKAVIADILIHFLIVPHTAIPEMLLFLYCGLGIVLGHNFPFYLNFKGGKGVASSVGLVIAFDWRIFVICAIVFFGLFFLTHYVSLCSVSAYLAAFISMIVFGQMGSYHMDFSHMIELYTVMGLLTVLAFYRHKKNIKRLLDGTESKIYLSKKNK